MDVDRPCFSTIMVEKLNFAIYKSFTKKEKCVLITTFLFLLPGTIALQGEGRGVKMLQTYGQTDIQTDRQTYRPSDEVPFLGAFAPKKGSLVIIFTYFP